jgi:hypothetical protein
MEFVCRLQVRTGESDGTCMVMHAQSHAQAELAARELFPSCRVEVVCVRSGRSRDRNEHCER